MTVEELDQVVLPEGKIGINDFCSALNRIIDTNKRKGLSGAKLNKYLKEIGVLEEQVDEEGHKMTVIADESRKHGLSTVEKNYGGRVYDQIVYSDEGKKFLMDIVKKKYLKAGDAFTGESNEIEGESYYD